MTSLHTTLRVVANQSKRTFTIRSYYKNKFFAKYRTIQFNQEEFESNEHNTEKDWLQFLSNTDDYYKV